MKGVLNGITTVLRNSAYKLVAVGVAVVFFVIFITIPVLSIPGNDILFQLSIYSPADYVLMVSLALLIGVTFAVRFYTMRKRKAHASSKLNVHTPVASIAGVFAATIGTAVCTACIASLLAVVGLGAGSAYFILEHRPYFLGAAIVLMLLSLYAATRKVGKVCLACQSTPNSRNPHTQTHG